MAFNKNYLILIGGSASATRQYLYLNKAGDDVTSSYFFSERDLNLGDQITVVSGTSNINRATYTVTDINNLDATVTISNSLNNASTATLASSATKLETARTIGGVSFDGTANINLPGVNTAGNQNTSGQAGSVANALTLGTGLTGISYNGSSAITATVSYGTTSTTSCVGNDSRLSDSRTPVAHAVNDSTYGYGDTTNAGHLRVGSGLTEITGTVAMGTPSSITSSSTNEVSLNSHTHAIEVSLLDLTTVRSKTANTPVNFTDSENVEVGTLCRAWVNFNGTGTVAKRASFNVSSITDNATGDYTVNFANPMPDTNYCVNATGMIGGAGAIAGINADNYTRTISAIRFYSSRFNNAPIDCLDFSVAIFR